MESEEEIDDFDLLNEGLMAWQIIEWFEKENSEPEVDWEKYEDWPEDKAIPETAWWDWQMRLHAYADGWKDALKAIEERKMLEKHLAAEGPTMIFFKYVYQFPQEYVKDINYENWYYDIGQELIALGSWKEELEWTTTTE